MGDLYESPSLTPTSINVITFLFFFYRLGIRANLHVPASTNSRDPVSPQRYIYTSILTLLIIHKVINDMANSCLLPSCFFFFSLILSHVMIVQIEASHYFHENLESVQPTEPDEKHRTSYHFQPPKNWMNGNFVFINSSIKKNETSFLLVFFFFELSSSFLTCFFALVSVVWPVLPLEWDVSLDLQTPMVRSLFPLFWVVWLSNAEIAGSADTSTFKYLDFFL